MVYNNQWCRDGADVVSMESSNAVVSRVFVLTEVASGEEGVVAFYYDV